MDASHQQAPVNAPGPAPVAAKTGGAIDQRDVDDWKNRFNELMANPSETAKQKSGEDAREWSSGFFSFFSPLDTCCITWCLPCITFGKTHHLTRKNGNLEGYEPINTSCLLFCGAACVGLHWIPEAMQRGDIRKKYNLQGSVVGDFARSFCCACCSLVQGVKEAEYREKELGGLASKQYHADETMEYAQKA